MIRYALQCENDHRFEGWFGDAAAFDMQACAGEVSCPICGSTKVEKAIMAPNVATSKRRSSAAPAEDTSAGTGGEAATLAVAGGQEQFAMQREFVEVMRKVRAEVVSKADYVGPRFAEEARKIHYEEVKPRGIYGEASRGDVEALSEEGIEFYPLPKLPEDQN